VQLKEFITRFESLSDDALRATFSRPFLLEAGSLLGKGPSPDDRRVFPLKDRGGVPLIVGRKAVADFQVDVNSVSSRHAYILAPDAAHAYWRLADSGSTNGTFVDGVKLTPDDPVRLQNGAAVRFGPDARFTFQEVDSFLRSFRRLLTAGGREPGNRAMHKNPTDPVMKVLELTDSGSAEPWPQGSDVELLIVCEPFDSMPLRPGETVVVGRSAKTATLVLPHKNVSRRHTEIERRGDQVFVRDLGSANGTFIGKTKVGSQAMELLIGKFVAIGPYMLKITGPTEALGHTAIVNLKDTWTAPVEGDLKEISALDLFNEVEMGQVTGVLRLELGTMRAMVSFRGGEPVDAETNEGLEGDAAVRLVMGLSQGRFWLNPEAKVKPAERSSRRVTRSFSELALEDFFDD
jgi:pSer/pThr/pTyr-binding forkhead associated (FHA) protein